MLVSWELLKDFVDVQLSPETVAERLTFSGSEVEGLTYCAGKMKGVVSARVDALEAMGKYYVANLSTGNVCVTSARNVKMGNVVLYAPAGAVLPDGTEMGTRDFGGVDSCGMMLSAEELGLHDVDDPSGLLILPPDTPAGVDASNLFHIGDIILDVSITPNRGDTLSLLGMAREIKGLFPEATLKTPQWMMPFPQNNAWPEEFGNISLPDEGCLCYRLGLATGATIKPSPLTARIDLSHLGMRPINNAVDVTNYVMLCLGQPLHAFDLNTLPAREITVRAAHEGETITTLDGKNRLLTERDMLITSGETPVALAGVMGGELTGVNADTTTIVIESACFSAQRVGMTSRRLGINSEAAFRFSRTVDPNLSATALSAASALMREWCGADVACKPLSAENSIPSPKPVTLTRRKLSTYLSWDNMPEARAILEGFGIECVQEGEDEAVFMPPTWRADIAIEEDLIEEVGRFRGYNEAEGRLPGEMPHRADVGERMRLSEYIRRTMMARGYTEVMTYSFLPEDFAEKLRLPADDERAHPLTLANPISREQAAMRTTLLPGLLMGLRNAVTSGWREPVRIFEQGRVFVGGKEEEHLCGVLFNGTDTRTWNGNRCEGFYEVKGDVESVLRGRGCRPGFRHGRERFLHGGQTAEVSADGERIGWAGRLRPELEQGLGVVGVYAFEVVTEGLKGERMSKFAEGSKYPPSYRDLSVIVGEGEEAEGVAREIHGIADRVSRGLTLMNVRLFDVYIAGGKRSLTFALSYGGKDRTLDAGEDGDVVVVEGWG